MNTLLKRPIESYNRIWLAVIALTTLTAVVAVTLIVGNLALGETKYRAEFAQAASIRPGDPVTVAGIEVGTVGDLALAGDRVVVTFKVRKDVHLGAETRAAIKLTTLLGSRYLEVMPAPTGQLTNQTVPFSNTSVPYDLQQAIAGATTTFEQIDADRIAESVHTLAQTLDGVPQALPQALENLKSLSALMAGRRDQLGTLLASTDTITSMIRDQRATVGALVLQGRDLLGELASRRAALQRLLAGVTVLVQRTRTVLGDVPAMNQLVTDTADLMGRVQKNDALLRNTMQILPVTLRNQANMSGTGMMQDTYLANGPIPDSLMCALSGRAKQFNLPEYFQDCQPVPDPWPGFPPPYEPAAQFPGFPPDTLATNTTAPSAPPAPPQGG